jgi:hypothetical protein
MTRSQKSPEERIVSFLRDAKLPNASMVVLYPIVGVLVGVLVVIAIFTYHSTPGSAATATRQAPLVHLNNSHPAPSSPVATTPATTPSAPTVPSTTTPTTAPTVQAPATQAATTPVRTLYGSTYAVPDAAYTLIRSTASATLQGSPDSLTVDSHSATSITVTAVRATSAGSVESATMTVTEHNGVWSTNGKQTG